MSRLYKLPLSIIEYIFEYDGRYKDNYNLCLKELEKNADKKIEKYKENYRKIRYFYNNHFKIRQLMVRMNHDYEKYRIEMVNLRLSTIELQSSINENKYNYTNDFRYGKYSIYTNYKYVLYNISEKCPMYVN